VAKEIVDAAFKAHQTLGPGLLESVYESCLYHELKKRGIDCAKQVPVNIAYDEITIEAGLRIDLLVADSIVVEVKALEMNPVYEAQLLTYLTLTNRRLGFLINFNTPIIKHGIKRMVL
jgi:GxxExxY protein